MLRKILVAIALALRHLAGCKGFYVAGDGGSLGARFSGSPPTTSRAPDDPISR